MTQKTKGKFMRARAVMSGCLACLCLGLALVISGCGSSGGSSGAAATSGSSEGGTGSLTSATFGMPIKIQTLDPDLALETSNQALHFIGGTLFDYVEGKTVPDLAESAKVSKDELTWVIQLKPNLKFSDGTPLTAKDVAATLERSRNDEANINLFLVEPISSVVAKGTSTLELHLKRPYPDLEYIMSLPFLSIFPADRIEKANFFQDPVSAGPYKLVSWGGGATAVFEANPNYVGSPASIPKLTLTTITDSNARLAQVKSGQLQLGYGLAPNQISQITAPAEKRIAKVYGLTMLSMQTKESPLDEQGVREAISDAIDRQQLSEIVWSGEAEPLMQIWPASMTAHDPSISAEQDLAAAEKALEGTKCAEGCTVQLTYSAEGYANQEQEAPVIKSDLEAIGIQVDLNNIDTATYLERAFNSEFQMVLTYLFELGDFPDSICPLALGSILNTNYTMYSMPGGEKACEKAIETTGSARVAAMREASDELMKSVPWTPLTSYSLVSASSVSESLVRVGSGTLIEVAHENGKVW
ncbi:MAG: ABC transporter substrate-binding protein [Solirubrobacterales bacterium]